MVDPSEMIASIFFPPVEYTESTTYKILNIFEPFMHVASLLTTLSEHVVCLQSFGR